MKFRATAPVPGTSTPIELAERALTADDLVAAVRQQQLADRVERSLVEQSARPAELRDRELVDLCLDLRNILDPAPSVPVVPGRS